MWYTNLSIINNNVPVQKMTNKKLAKMKNNVVWQNEFVRDLLDATNNRYKITGLPDTCRERVVLQSLLWTGAVYFFEMNGNLMALPGAPDGSGLNVYGDYAGAWVWGANGFNEHIDLFIEGTDQSRFLAKTAGGQTASTNAKGVMVRENQYLYPFINQVMYYAERQADTLRKIEVAEKNAATPYFITAEQSVIPTIKDNLTRMDNNEDRILGTGIYPADRVQIQPIDIQVDCINIMTATYDWYCNHFRELCGVKNTTNIDKKGENLISDEVNVNDEYTSMQSIMPQLQHDLDIVNQVFGTSIGIEEKHENIESDNGDNEPLSESNRSGATSNDQ